jgi:HlyD family secretion protein
MRWVKRSLLVVGAVAIVAFIIRAWLPKPVAVETGTVARMALDTEVNEEGQTRVRDRFVVSAPISGTLLRIELQPGNAVEAGAKLAAIEPPAPALLDERSRREAAARLQAALAHERGASAAIARAQAARDAAVREADRARTLLEHGAITASERDKYETEEQLAVRGLTAAEADRLAAGAEVSAARAVLGTNRDNGRPASIDVVAPVRGVVLKVLRESMGPVATGTPLLELGDLGAIEVVVDVLSSDAARIRPGMRCEVTGWGGDGTLAATVQRVEPSAFTRISALGVEEQRVNVILTLAKAPPSLGDGFRVDARIVTWHGDNVLTVPASAVFRDHERWAVYAVQDGKARLVPITIGHRGRLQVEVLGGLTEGTAIVLHPTDAVHDGVSVVPLR